MLIIRRLQKRPNFRENQSKTSVRGKESILVSGKLSLYKTNWINTEARSYFRQKDIRDIFFHESARIRTNAGRALFASIRKEWIILLHAPLSLFISHRFHRSTQMRNPPIRRLGERKDLWRSVRSVWHSPTMISSHRFHRSTQMRNPPIVRLGERKNLWRSVRKI